MDAVKIIGRVGCGVALGYTLIAIRRFSSKSSIEQNKEHFNTISKVAIGVLIGMACWRLSGMPNQNFFNPSGKTLILERLKNVFPQIDSISKNFLEKIARYHQLPNFSYFY